MDEFRFNTVDELYKKLLPALNTKVNNLKRKYINYITEKDIWQYLTQNYWKNSNKLTLSDMVNDILTTPDYILEEFKQTKTNKNISEDFGGGIL